MERIRITTKLTFSDFRKVNFFLLYRKKATRVSLILGLILLLVVFIHYVIGAPFWTQFPTIPLAIAFALTVFPPYSVLRNAKKSYESNKMGNEVITYEIDKTTISISGESFNSSVSWDKLYQVEVTKSWLLIWQTREVVNVIPRQDISDDQLEMFREMITHNKSVKKSITN